MSSHSLTYFLFLAFTIVFLGCDSDARQETLFYPVDSLLNEQVRELNRRHAILNKVVVMAGKSSSAEYVPADSTAWKKEFEIFYHINNVNKPVNKTSYEVGISKEGSGLNVLTIVAKEELPIEFVKVYYEKHPREIVRLEARVQENNSMYEGTRDLKMQFHKLNGKTVTSDFQITGGQEMFLADSVQYSISGTISISN
jgi:hypothetical protein